MQAGNKIEKNRIGKPFFRPGKHCLNILIVLILLAVGGFTVGNSCISMSASPKTDRFDHIKSSPNLKKDRFVNTLPSVEPPLLKTLVEWIKGGTHTTPKKPLPVIGRHKEEFSEFPESGLRITWLGHSTALVEIDGKRFLTDPMWSEKSSPVSWAGPKRFFKPPLALDDLPPIDAVLISHNHYDHLDKPTVQHLANTGTQFILPLGVGAHLEAWDISASQIRELDWWEAVTIDDLTITATPARHFSGRSVIMADRDRTLWSGFAISGSNHKVYYTGDTAMFEGFTKIGERLGPFDVVLVEVGAYNRLWADVHLGPEQAVQAVKMAKGKLIIPVHWATFDLAMHSWTEPAERLMVSAAVNNVSLAIPKPGQSVEPSNPPTVTRWWPEIPWQTAKEHPIVSSGQNTYSKK